MTSNQKTVSPSPKRLITAFAAATLAVGTYWWPPSYTDIQIMPSGWVFALLAVVVAAIFASSTLSHAMMIGATAAFGALAAMIIRIVFDVIDDPTSHNLWPFELVIASFFIVPSALLGAAVGMMMKRFFSRE